MFFSDNILEDITTEMNSYAQSMLSEEKYAAFTKITSDEIRAYLGFAMLMSVVVLPSLGDYWSNQNNLHYKPVAGRITRQRYQTISRYLHFVDNSTLASRGHVNYDRLGKVRPILETVNANFQAVYNPHREVSIDEATIKFQGRSSLKQYNPMKPIKRGIKSWILADAHNGYFHTVKVRGKCKQCM